MEPLDDVVVDQDLWAILGWMIDGVGAPWTVEDSRDRPALSNPRGGMTRSGWNDEEDIA